MARIAVQMIDAWIEKHAFQEQSARSEHKYRQLFENSLNGIFQATMDGRFLMVNSAYARILGCASPEDLMAAITDIAGQIYVRPEERSHLIECLERDGRVEGFVTQVMRCDGKHIDVSVHARLLHDPDTGVPYFEGQLEDITEQRQTERAIRLFEEKYFKALNNSPVWVVLSSLATGRFIEVNHTFLRTMGYTREEVIGRTSQEIGAWAYPADREAIIGIIRTHGSIRNFEVRRCTKTGHVLTMLFSADVTKISGESCILSVSQDISERKRMEKRLRQSENNLRITLDAIGDAVVATDEATVYSI